MDRRKRRYELITTAAMPTANTPISISPSPSSSSTNTTNSTLSNLTTGLVGGSGLNTTTTSRGVNSIFLSSSSSSSIVNGVRGAGGGGADGLVAFGSNGISSSSYGNIADVAAAIPSNVFLTICDDDVIDGYDEIDDDEDEGDIDGTGTGINSDESQEYIEIDESVLTAHLQRMGQNHNLNIMTIPAQAQAPPQAQVATTLMSSSSVSTIPTTTTTASMHPATTTIQYRIVNHGGEQSQGQQLQLQPIGQQGQHDFSTTLASLPANVQLPSSCEIYLLKPYTTTTAETTTIANVKNNNSNNNNNYLQTTEFLQANQQQQLQHQQQQQQQQETLATIKLEPDLIELMNSNGDSNSNAATTANLLVINNNSNNNNNNNNIHKLNNSALRCLATNNNVNNSSSNSSSSSASSGIGIEIGSINKHYISKINNKIGSITTLNGLSIKAPPTATPSAACVTSTSTSLPLTVSTVRTDFQPTVLDLETLQKRNVEAYKKRDDKRRATHNEVERRRRDKINYWIFKLKEMLPNGNDCGNSGLGFASNWQQVLNNLNIVGGVDIDDGIGGGSISTSCSLTSRTTQTAATVTGTIRSNNNNTPPNGRLPPSDSKSQILIKACDYIKSMQGEIIGLRECLKENESLRVKNQRLEFELDTARQKLQHHQHQQNKNIVPSSSLVTLNALNGTDDLYGGIDTASTVDITKRDLIIGISDYVD